MAIDEGAVSSAANLVSVAAAVSDTLGIETRLTHTSEVFTSLISGSASPNAAAIASAYEVSGLELESSIISTLLTLSESDESLAAKLETGFQAERITALAVLNDPDTYGGVDAAREAIGGREMTAVVAATMRDAGELDANGYRFLAFGRAPALQLIPEVQAHLISQGYDPESTQMVEALDKRSLTAENIESRLGINWSQYQDFLDLSTKRRGATFSVAGFEPPARIERVATPGGSAPFAKPASTGKTLRSFGAEGIVNTPIPPFGYQPRELNLSSEGEERATTVSTVVEALPAGRVALMAAAVGDDWDSSDTVEVASAKFAEAYNASYVAQAEEARAKRAADLEAIRSSASEEETNTADKLTELASTAASAQKALLRNFSRLGGSLNKVAPEEVTNPSTEQRIKLTELAGSTVSELTEALGRGELDELLAYAHENEHFNKGRSTATSAIESRMKEVGIAVPDNYDAGDRYGLKT